MEFIVFFFKLKKKIKKKWVYYIFVYISVKKIKKIFLLQKQQEEV